MDYSLLEREYEDFPTSRNAWTCSYTPNPGESVAVMNANRRELYDYAEWLNLTTLPKGGIPELYKLLPIVINQVPYCVLKAGRLLQEPQTCPRLG